MKSALSESAAQSGEPVRRERTATSDNDELCQSRSRFGPPEADAGKPVGKKPLTRLQEGGHATPCRVYVCRQKRRFSVNGVYIRQHLCFQRAGFPRAAAL
jgi:hypothetical protein